MPKGTILDRLAGAMKTLGKREGKALTPRQRVAAAQRWNSLADIGEDEVAMLEALADETGNRGAAQSRYVDADEALVDMNINNGNGFRADNPFLSDNIDKYAEQSDFLDWCRYNKVEPNSRSLKQFRWEIYKMLPERQRVWIANKDAIKSYLGPEMWHYDEKELDRINTIDELEEYLQTRHPEDDWPNQYPLYNDEVTPVYESFEEFPDDFDYMWRR